MTDWNSLFGAAGFVALDDPVGADVWSELPVGSLADEVLNPGGDIGLEFAADGETVDDDGGDDDGDDGDADDLLMGWRDRRSVATNVDRLPAHALGPADDDSRPVDQDGFRSGDAFPQPVVVSDDGSMDDHLAADLGMTSELVGAEAIDGPGELDAGEELDDMDDPEFDL